MDEVVLHVTRAEVGMILDALDLMEDLEYLRPERQIEIANVAAKITQLVERELSR